MRRVMQRRAAVTGIVVTLVAGLSAWGLDDPPDLTKSGITVDRKSTYNLGPTGLRGWIYTKPANFFESQQGRTTTASRQILVTHVGKGSPADGVIKVDDILLGVGGKLFSDDARKAIGAAIGEAEKTAQGGVLQFLRWREGKTETAQIKLNVLGAYTDTAPYDCPKSTRILAEACKVLEKEPLKEDWSGAVTGLALLATGNPDYLPRVQAFARKIAPQTLTLVLKDGMVAWEWGYRNLFLCEYYLLTGDKEVLPAIREYTIKLAQGQGMYGTYGHGIAPPTADGKLHGSIPPYGPVNAAGLPANIAIAMGKKCGVTDPELEPALWRGSKFFGYYVGKGAIPYGEHLPWANHDNNGKNAMAAILFALQDNQVEPAQYFSKMVTASYQNREYGHTGQGFSYLWGALGANAGGPAAAAAFFKEASWHLDLSRRCDGSFAYDGGEQYGPGKTDDNTYYGRSSYSGLSPTASYVLTYSLPLKKLHLTGKGANTAYWLSKKDVTEAIASGRFDVDCRKKTTEEVVAALGDWSPITRGWAAAELASRADGKAMVPRLMTLAEGGNAKVRQGACEALGLIKNADALPVLVRLLAHEDRWLRVKAANALKTLRDTARPVISEMLKAAAATAEPLRPIVWADPIQLAHGELAEALFGGLLRSSIKGIEPALLYPAIRAVSRNPDGMARARLRNTFENLLTEDDVQALAPDILAAVTTPCPADTMFGNEIRMGGFKALTKYRFKEGLQAGVLFAKTQGGHGSESRTGVIMKEIMGYGTAARDILPELRELIVALNAQCKKGEFPAGELNNRRVSAVEEAIKSIEAAKDQPPLRTLATPSQGEKGGK